MGAEVAFTTIQDIVWAARQKLSTPMWEFITYGTDSDTTVLRNRQAFDSLAFRPRIMRDVSDIDIATEIIGEPLRMPVMLSPVGALRRIDPTSTGTVAAARAVADFGVMQVVSGVIPDYAEIPKASGARLVYAIQGDIEQAFADDLPERAVEAGYRAIAFVSEAAYFSRRERDITSGLISGRKSPQSYATYLRERRAERESGPIANDKALKFDWKLLEKIKQRSKLPLFLKGVTTGEDAVRALDHGVDVLYVSNHGGRALDHCRGTADALVEVVAAARGRADVIVDGGITRGSDIVKAVARGAKAVCIGRLQAWAFAAAAGPGVLRMLEILEEEIVVTMGLLGVSSLAELTPDHLVPAEPVYAPHPLNAFPIVMERLRHL